MASRNIKILPKDEIADRKALLNLIRPDIEAALCDVSHAYRAGRSVKTAITEASKAYSNGYEWAMSTDVRKFFDSIAQPVLMRMVDRTIGGRAAKCIDLILKTDNPSGLGITQGCPLSPALSNLYLDGVDRELSAWPMKVIRYADNILCLCKSKEGAAFACLQASEAVNNLGLNLKPEVTEIAPAGNVVFLGRRIGFHLNERTHSERQTISVSYREIGAVST